MSNVGSRLLLLALWMVAWLVGCEAPPRADAPTDGPEAQVASAADEHARELQAVLTQQPPHAPGPEAQAQAAPPPVRWLDPQAPAPQTTAAQTAPRPGAFDPSLSPAPTPLPTQSSPPPDHPAASPAPPAGPTPAALSRDELVAQLLATAPGQGNAAMQRAMQAAALSLLDPKRPLDAELLKGLDPTQRQTVQRFHALVLELGRRVADGKGELDSAAVAGELDRVLGEQPIRIRRIELCKRVSGYGVYEPFTENTFLAGRENPMIVYVELENYRSVQTRDLFEVKLQQEVVLYNESDGLAVWRPERATIVDESRNKRRDFFVVQLVRMPARTSVGKYLLKVSITDMHGGSIDEGVVSIQVVADQGMVRGRPAEPSK